MNKICQIVSASILAIFLILPLPYIIETPGPTLNVLSKYDNNQITTIKLDGKELKNANIDIRLTTVSVYGGPDRYLNILGAIDTVLNPTYIVYPQESMYPLTTSVQEVSNSNKKAMDNSQNHAIYAALKSLGYKVELNNDETIRFPKDVDVTLTTSNIGGPSAGLEFALGIYSTIKYRDKHIPNLPIISGTGTIGWDSNVGEIGGISQKIISSINTGASYFFMPITNCKDLDKSAINNNQIQLIPVSTLSQAESYLDKIISGERSAFPKCKVS